MTGFPIWYRRTVHVLVGECFLHLPLLDAVAETFVAKHWGESISGGPKSCIKHSKPWIVNILLSCGACAHAWRLCCCYCVLILWNPFFSLLTTLRLYHHHSRGPSVEENVMRQRTMNLLKRNTTCPNEFPTTNHSWVVSKRRLVLLKSRNLSGREIYEWAKNNHRWS